MSGFRWNKTQSQILKDKGFGTSLNKKFAELAYASFAQYTPRDTGELQMNVTIGANKDMGYIKYLTPYASSVFYNTHGYTFKTTHNALACEQWHKPAWSAFEGTITRELSRYRRMMR